jgi:hypothetical protein
MAFRYVAEVMALIDDRYGVLAIRIVGLGRKLDTRTYR